LRVPLVVKLLGANLLVAVVASAVAALWEGRDLLVLGGITLAASLGLSMFLVQLALGPLDQLEAAARHIAVGDFGKRVDPSPVADERFDELRESFNRLLLQIEQDRSRIRQLARMSLEMREAERATLAETLREATAQQIAALSMQLAVAATENSDPQVAARIDAAREIAIEMADDVAAMADSVFPGLLGELGLPAALEALGRRVANRSSMTVTADVAGCRPDLPLPLVRVLFRVAEEAVRNAEVHAHARTLRITLESDEQAVRLRVEDDGAGFDAVAAERDSNGVGLFRAKELLANAGGQIEVATAPGQGATITAVAPIPEKAIHAERHHPSSSR
jgi:two-component system sensor histidine kinase UhpB